MLASIFSVEGVGLSEKERVLFQNSNPCGFILFGRNIEDPTQLKSLISDLKSCVGRDCPILIDQEGGRVQRLRAPHWTNFPPALSYQGDQNTLVKDMSALSQELVDVGFNVNCAPVLDVQGEATHDSIGDRAYGSNIEEIIDSSSTVIDCFLAHNIVPVIKHLPGQGRAQCDSHDALPCIEESVLDLSAHDFLPCQAISQKYGAQIWGMVAHVLYKEIDSNLPATLSPRVLEDVIRQKIEFCGFLVSDDISMGALTPFGSVVERAQLALDAGCDCILYCAGLYEEMEQLAQSLPSLSEGALKRLGRT